MGIVSRADKAPTQEIILRVLEKYSVMSNEIESLIQIYPFLKPPVRSEAPKTVDAFEKLHALQISRSSMPNNCAWIFLRLFSHGQVPLSSVLWSTGHYHSFLVRIPVINRWKTCISHCGWICINSMCQTLRYVNSVYSHEKRLINVNTLGKSFSV